MVDVPSKNLKQNKTKNDVFYDKTVNKDGVVIINTILCQHQNELLAIPRKYV